MCDIISAESFLTSASMSPNTAMMPILRIDYRIKV